jgi:hypothetical protein
MINFFRKIRKKLADDNKPLKYARYAIGEIVLVVIGILIALSINNWNEGRKNRTTEVEVLQNLSKCLENNIKRLEGQLALNQRSVKASDIILHTIANKLPHNDSLNSYIGYASNVDDTGSIFSAYGYAKFGEKAGNVLLAFTLE